MGYLLYVTGYTPASPITAVTGGVLVASDVTRGSYTNRLGQTVVTLATPNGMLPAITTSVPNPADAPTQPLLTAAPAALKDQDEAGIHPLAPQYPGSGDPLSDEIAAIED